MSPWNAVHTEATNSRTSSGLTGAGSMAGQLMGILPRHADRDHHRLRHVRAARVRIRRPELVSTDWGDALVSRGAFAGAEVLHVSRHGEGHRRLSNLVTHRANIAALAELGADAVIGVTVCGAVDPAVELGSLVCFDDLHFLANRLGDGELCTFYSEPGDRRRGHWIFEGPFSEPLRRALLDGGARGGRGDPRRRLLRPRRRAALQHARRDPRPGGLRRHARVADRRPGGGAVRRGRAAVRAARLRDRLRQRRHRGGDARCRRCST